MLIKENTKSWSDSVNFIDENDNFVGFDMNSNCCEDFGWYITYEPIGFSSSYNVKELTERELVGFKFDTTFVDDYDFDETVVFRLVSDQGGVAYLHLYNSHNGYYSHGWESNFAGDGCL